MDGIDIRVVLDVTSQLTMEAGDVYTNEGDLIEDKLEVTFHITLALP